MKAFSPAIDDECFLVMFRGAVCPSPHLRLLQSIGACSSLCEGKENGLIASPSSRSSRWTFYIWLEYPRLTASTKARRPPYLSCHLTIQVALNLMVLIFISAFSISREGKVRIASCKWLAKDLVRWKHWRTRCRSLMLLLYEPLGS